jgi:hypothetical protein
MVEDGHQPEMQGLLSQCGILLLFGWDIGLCANASRSKGSRSRRIVYHALIAKSIPLAID